MWDSLVAWSSLKNSQKEWHFVQISRVFPLTATHAFAIIKSARVCNFWSPSPHVWIGFVGFEVYLSPNLQVLGRLNSKTDLDHLFWFCYPMTELIIEDKTFDTCRWNLNADNSAMAIWEWQRQDIWRFTVRKQFRNLREQILIFICDVKKKFPISKQNRKGLEIFGFVQLSLKIFGICGAQFRVLNFVVASTCKR